MTRTNPRSKMTMVALAVGLVLALTACLSPGQTNVADSLNAARRNHGLRALPTHQALNQKAQAWAEKLARDNALSHSRLSDGLPSCWRSVGENVGQGSTVAAVQNAYMNSSGHRANVLNGKWDHVGVGHAVRGDRVFTVQVFIQGCT